MAERERFFFDQDNDCHWYIIPAAKRSAWEKWCGLDIDDDRSLDVPDFAKPLGGGPKYITFTEPDF